MIDQDYFDEICRVVAKIISIGSRLDEEDREAILNAAEILSIMLYNQKSPLEK